MSCVGKINRVDDERRLNRWGWIVRVLRSFRFFPASLKTHQNAEISNKPVSFKTQTKLLSIARSRHATKTSPNLTRRGFALKALSTARASNLRWLSAVSLARQLKVCFRCDRSNWRKEKCRWKTKDCKLNHQKNVVECVSKECSRQGWRFWFGTHSKSGLWTCGNY